MKLKDAREHYYTHSGKLSDVNRQLCFAGIATVWIFVIKDSNGNFTFPNELLLPLGCFVFGLFFDLLQYVFSTASWGVFSRIKENENIGEEAEFVAPPSINWAPIIFFGLKVCATLIGFGVLLYILIG
jgi:hypothetical protein